MAMLSFRQFLIGWACTWVVRVVGGFSVSHVVHRRLDIRCSGRVHPQPPNHGMATTTTTSTRLEMSLIPLQVEDLQDLISVDSTPTASQYAAYWGRTPRERYARLVETFLVSVLGMVFSYSLSFVLGGFAGTILGAVFLFWGIFTPQLKAAQRNWEFLGGRSLIDYYYDDDDEQGDGLFRGAAPRGLYGALYLGRLDHVSVVESATSLEEYDLEEFQDYTMETDELEQYTGNPYLLRVRCVDRRGRKLQVHAHLSEEYLDLVPGLSVTTLLLSPSKEFDQLAALTDLYIPATETYIGDYPYLHRDGVQNLLATDDYIWNSLQGEATQTGEEWIPNQPSANTVGNWEPSSSWEPQDNPEYEDGYYSDFNNNNNQVFVPRRRHRRKPDPPSFNDKDPRGSYY